jgi:hypothetical protein
MIMTASPSEQQPFSNAEGGEGRHNPAIITLLGSAGLTAVDLQFFDSLREQGQTIFVHGSIVADRMSPSSDVDFTVIGELSDLAPDLRDTLMPGLITAYETANIDYVSTSFLSQGGRKISLHMSEPSFRESSPSSHPFATEYRPARHAKKNDRKYFLPGVDRDGTIHLINFLCHSSPVESDGSTITDTPQTGQLLLKGDTFFVEGKVKPGITADAVVKIRPDGSVTEALSEDISEIMILGLEFDKMQSDTALYSNADAVERYVKAPSRRSMEAVGVFTKTDPEVMTQRLFSELAKYWPQMKPNKSR